MKNTYFTPGPAELYPTVERHVKTALDEQVGSISHRSALFRKLYQHTDEQLRTLLSIPKTHAVLFTGSATEVWERVLMNCVEHESFHLVNGAFSRKFYDFSVELGKFAHLYEKPVGEGFDYADVVEKGLPEYAELVCLTANETATGAQMRPVDMHKLKRSYRSKLFCVDMVSSAPHPELDFELIDSAFFSVQKAFGLPAGLGVWIVNEKCLDKAERLRRAECNIGTYHSLPTLWKNYKNFETPETPNVWAIYLLGKVAEDFNRLGIDTIRKETDAKAKLLYNFLEKDPRFSPAVKNPAHRSATVVVANVKGSSTDCINRAKEASMIVGSGYGAGKEKQIRIANFPAVSLERVEQLVEVLKKL